MRAHLGAHVKGTGAMLDSKNAVVGTKQVLKAVQAGVLQCVYLAEDVEAFLHNKIRSAAEDAGLEVKSVSTMKELGERCGIDVGAACVGVRKEAP